MSFSGIRYNFSKNASTYDKFSDIQRLTGQMLIDIMPDIKPEKVLEIGCGSGNYTVLLRKRFKNSQITAVDISPEMIQVAYEKLKGSGVEFKMADAEIIKLEERYDLITSNATIHWFTDLDAALKSYKAALTGKGMLAFSFFGPKTFNELSQSLKATISDETYISADRFLDKKSLETLLRANFRKVSIDEEMIKNDSESLMELLNGIKFTGTRGVGLGNPYLLNRETLAKLEQVYKEKFGGIVATYQVFFCGAQL